MYVLPPHLDAMNMQVAVLITGAKAITYSGAVFASRTGPASLKSWTQSTSRSMGAAQPF